VDNSHSISEQLNEQQKFNKIMAADYARFVARLHQKGVIDIDLNAGNGRYTFSLIDINRMKFFKGYPPMDECLENLTRFTGRMDVFEYVAHEYVKARGWDDAMVMKLLEAKKKHDWKWEHRKDFSRYFKRNKK